MSYGKVFDYKDGDGADKTVFLKPVSPMKFREIFRLAKKIHANPEGFVESMDDATVNDLVSLCIETMDRSCPNWAKEDKEDFITMNFVPLMEAIFTINSPKK